MKKLTRIQQQEQIFRESIKFDGWTIINGLIYHSRVGDYFQLYHDVTFEYYTEPDKEKFVKKWWSKIMEPHYKIEDIRRSIPLNKKIIHAQQAVYSIHWDNAAIRIVKTMAEAFTWRLNR